MIRQLIKLSILSAAALALSGCIPNPKLEAGHTAPPVTGPFDLYFPNAEQVFTGPENVSIAESKTRIESDKKEVVPVKGEVPIGLLFPKSGHNAKLGQDFEDAAVLALYDAKLAFPGGYRLTLIPKDTAGSPSVAVEKAKELKRQGVKIFVGPLYSQSTEAITQAVEPDLMFSLSNNLEALSNNSFIFGFTPESEMLRALTYALKTNKKRVSAILPNNEYGRKLATVLRNVTPGFGANLDAVEFYVTSKAGRKAAAGRLANRIRGVGTDIICFGDTRENSIALMDHLDAENVNVAGALKVGTSLWHDESRKVAPKLMHLGIYAASDDRSYNRFKKRFRSANSREPQRLSLLVYDAVTLLAELASTGNIPTRQDLMAAEVIQGSASGAYRFETDGSVTRALSLYELTPNGYKVIENAPKSF